MSRLCGHALILLALLLTALPAPAEDPGEPQALDEAALGGMIESFVRSRAQGPVRAVAIPRLDGFTLDRVADFDVALSTHPQQAMAGWVPLTVAVSSGGETLRRGVITVRVDSERRVVVTRRSLRRGTILTAADLMVEPRSASELSGASLSELDLAVGKRLRRSLAAGATVSSDHLDLPPAVRRGQRVKLELQHGRLRIEGFGRAQQDGRLGDWIRVRNLTSKREVTGLVAGDGVVRVDL